MPELHVPFQTAPPVQAKQAPQAPSGSKHLFRFPKSEKLCSETTIKELFTKGKAVSQYPFRVLLHTEEAPANPYQAALYKGQGLQVLISVPKRNHKLAVTRNLLKRRIREAWRLNRQNLTFTPQPGIRLSVALVYTGKEVSDFALISRKLVAALHKASALLQPVPRPETVKIE